MIFEIILLSVGSALFSGMVGNAAYDVFKKIAKSSLPDSAMDEDILKDIYSAVDNVSEEFFNIYKDSFGEPNESFLARQSNIELIIKSFFYSRSIDLNKELDRSGYNEAPQVSEDALKWFTDKLQAEFKKSSYKLDKIITEKEHIRTTENIEKMLRNYTKPADSGINLDAVRYLPRPMELIIGRDTAVKDIEALMDRNHRIINIIGVPGIGRKTVCRHFLNTRGESHDVFWIHYAEDLKSSFLKLLGRYLNEPEDMDNIISELNTNPKYRDAVLVISDFNNIKDASLKILYSLKMKVLITSCVNFHSDYIKDYQLGFLDEDFCSELFLKNYIEDGVSSEDSVKLLVKLCGRHTMAIKLLGKTAKVNNLSVEELLLHLKEKGFNLNQIAPMPIENELTFALLSEHLEKLPYWTNLNDDEFRLLTQLAVLPCQGIDKSLIDIMDYKHETVNKLVVNGFLEDNGDEVAMHNVIQSIVREKTKPDYEKCSETIRYVMALDSGCYYYGSSILNWIRESNESTVQLCLCVGISCYKSLLFSQALKYFLLAEEKNNSLHDYSKRKHLIDANKANIYFCLGNYNEAYSWISEAYPGFWDIFKHEREHDLIILVSAVVIFNQYGDYEKAVKSYKKAVKIIKKLKYSNSHVLLTLYNNIAKLHVNMKDYSRAKNSYLEAKQVIDSSEDLMEKYLPLWYINYSILLNNTEKKGSTLARDYLEKALEISESRPVKNYLDIIGAKKELGVYWVNNNEYLKAEKCFLGALKIYEEYSVVNNIEKGKLYFNLGEVYCLMHNYPVSEQYFLKSERMLKSGVLPDNHRLFKTLYGSMAELYSMMRRPEEFFKYSSMAAKM